MVILSDFNADQYNIPLNKIESEIPSFQMLPLQQFQWML